MGLYRYQLIRSLGPHLYRRFSSIAPDSKAICLPVKKIKTSKWVNPSLIQRYEYLQSQMDELQEFRKSEDAELQKIALEDVLDIEKEMTSLSSTILDGMVNEVDQERLITQVYLDVSGGVGGQEAMLFAAELLALYSYYASWKGWTWNETQRELSDLGGIKRGVVSLSGSHVFQYMRHEAGIHRVQRVPATERTGRIHTSTVAVAVIPVRPDAFDEIIIKEDDLKWETMRSQGPGGQNVNKRESAVRLTHLPSGLIVERQTQRSQEQNKTIALKRLREMLAEQKVREEYTRQKATKWDQCRDWGRSEKIRTYQFLQDRITDHRLNTSQHAIESFMSGQRLDLLNEMIEALETRYRQKCINLILDDIKD